MSFSFFFFSFFFQAGVSYYVLSVFLLSRSIDRRRCLGVKQPDNEPHFTMFIHKERKITGFWRPFNRVGYIRMKQSTRSTSNTTSGKESREPRVTDKYSDMPSCPLQRTYRPVEFPSSSYTKGTLKQKQKGPEVFGKEKAIICLIFFKFCGSFPKSCSWFPHRRA